MTDGIPTEEARQRLHNSVQWCPVCKRDDFVHEHKED